MDDQFELRYRAIDSRDPRFDGRFVTAVTSTGIYCRPSCPAQTPLREHVRFYRLPEAALAAGFRACKRCRPGPYADGSQSPPGGDLAARALTAIARGALDEDGVPRLAAELGVGSRQLQRALLAAVGVAPLALARSRRAQTARVLLESTSMTVTEAAFAAGFSSLRQFNETMLQQLGCAPGQLRRRGPGEGEVSLAVRIPHRPPYAAAALLEWLGRGSVEGVEEVDSASYRRVLPGGAVAEITPLWDHSLIRLRGVELAALPEAVARCRRLLDAEADPIAVDAALSGDSRLRALVRRRPGLRAPGCVDGFEMAVRAALGGGLAPGRAGALAGRLAGRWGRPLASPSGGLLRCFPEASALAEATSYGGLGLQPSLEATLRALAQAHLRGQLELSPGADPAAARRSLMEVPGMGEAAAAEVVMRATGDPDQMPLPAAWRRRLGSRPDGWRPWRSYAAQHLLTAPPQEREQAA